LVDANPEHLAHVPINSPAHIVPLPATPHRASPFLAAGRLTPGLSERSIGTCPCQASITNSEADCGSLSLM
jgi:hypothetical protein